MNEPPSAASRGPSPGPRPRGLARAGFTLIEVAAVLLILALLAGAVAVSVHGAERRLRLADVAERVTAWDRLAREHARRFGRPIRLEIDLNRAEFARVDLTSRSNEGTGVTLPDGFSVAEVRLATGKTTSGRVGISCSSTGRTPSYAVRLTGPKDSEMSLLVSGMTGQVTRIDHENLLDDIFRRETPTTAEPDGLHAH